MKKQYMADNYFSKNDYLDRLSYKFVSKNNIELKDAAVSMFNTSPAWVVFLLKLRNILVKPFGLAVPEDKIKQCDKNIVKGEKFGMFTVIDFNDEELLLGDKDKHLDFVTSVILNKNINNYELISITAVKYNNWFGKFYFTFVKPFHCLIVKNGLKQAVKLIA